MKLSEIKLYIPFIDKVELLRKAIRRFISLIYKKYWKYFYSLRSGNKIINKLVYYGEAEKSLNLSKRNFIGSFILLTVLFII